MCYRWVFNLNKSGIADAERMFSNWTDATKHTKAFHTVLIVILKPRERNVHACNLKENVTENMWAGLKKRSFILTFL